MQKYYLQNGNESIGPFSIEELKSKSIKKTTPVWCDGMDDWKDAEHVEDLKRILIGMPPPIIKSTPPPINHHLDSGDYKPMELNNSEEKTNWWVWLGKVIATTVIILAILGIIINYTNNRNSSSKVFTPLLTIPQKEAANPTNYLIAGGDYHENFWGTKLKINGYIQNNATVTTYKDITIEITYYSKTNTPLSSKRQVIYEFLPPYSTKNFNLTIDNYSNASSVGWNVISASVK